MARPFDHAYTVPPTLPRDALQIGSDNHPYLRYLNVKLRREAVIPVGPVLRERLDRQERYVNEIYGPEGISLLLPSPPEGAAAGDPAGLDHGSIEMTARYAHLNDETVKREITAYNERVNIRGERIALPVGGPLEEAAWMKERIARAKQALANGYCGLPLVPSCPHPTRA